MAGKTHCRIAMNRDERIARGPGRPLESHEVRGTTAIYPSDGAGGTWIGANEYGLVLALLNWNDVTSSGKGDTEARSRGQVIPALAGCRCFAELGAALQESNRSGILPFRLVGVCPSEKRVHEWRWDSPRLESQSLPWEPQHWFSSSLSDAKAESLRGAASRAAHCEPDAGSIPWLRRLHSSHAAGAGPFSLCVHRDDVKTLSYTEVSVEPTTVAVEHFLGSPCSMRSSQRLEMKRVLSIDSSRPEFAGLTGI
jgi:hypothetical protein